MTAEQVHRLAFAQKLVIYAILGYLLLIGLQVCISGSMRRDPAMQPVLLIIGLGSLLVVLAVIVCMFVGVILLSNALGQHVLVTIVRCFFLLVPCLGLAVLFVLSQKATTELKKRGVRVGLLGARSEDLANVGDDVPDVADVFD